MLNIQYGETRGREVERDERQWLQYISQQSFFTRLASLARLARLARLALKSAQCYALTVTTTLSTSRGGKRHPQDPSGRAISA
mgnify:CR=1 FL=1